MLTDLPLEKQLILNTIRSGYNVCITGPAGTGKSFLLKKIKEIFPKVHITASTGVAAVNVEGVTIHSWAGLGNAKNSLEEIIYYIKSGPGTKVRRRIKKAKLLAIDEVSMISANVFGLLDQVLQEIRDNTEPFGGLQIIVIGDFCQLPPVEENNIEKLFCFESDSWNKANFHIFQLKEIYRQSNQRFIDLLNNIRLNQLTEDDIELLKSRNIENFTHNIDCTILVTHNYQSDLVNEKELQKLSDDKSKQYKMSASGNEKFISFLRNNCLAKDLVTLKPGAQVMMLRNTLAKHGIINGSVGEVIGFSTQDFPIVKFRTGQVQTIKPEEWCIESYDELQNIRKVEASIKQIPLALAWAITIHKSQGLTLDNVLCDLQRVFIAGQIYVALSRARDIESLYLKNFNIAALKTNYKVQEFYKYLIETNP